MSYRCFAVVLRVQLRSSTGGIPDMHSLLQDLRYTLRQWRCAPGFAIMAVLTLALGIGANTAIFLLTYTILLKGLPVPHPGQLVDYAYSNGHGTMPFSYKEYAALEQHVG